MTAGAFQTVYNGGEHDGYLTQLSADGTALVFSTFIGGSVFDMVYAITLDETGAIYLAGRTTSSNFLRQPGHTTRHSTQGTMLS
ncbi:MAG: hypothetical protein MZV49_12970 [Rhodopseudomonas palustris]|nr:hypothetical protein [Rhodopseudomonas palustris]